MKNHRPYFSDKEISLIEFCSSHLTGNKVFKEGFSPDDLNDLWWKCKSYRIGFRICKECNAHRECKDLNEQLICVKCQSKVQADCYHGCYHKEDDNHWHCSVCGKIDDDLGGMY